MTASANTPADNTAIKPFVISRTFDAPRDLVWKAWSEHDRFVQWFGPKGSTIKQAKMDFRPGKTLLYSMEFNGREMWGKFLFREITAPERIIWVNCFSDAEGGTTRHPFAPNWPLEMLTTATFEAVADNKTKVTIQWLPLNATEAERQAFESMREGMNQGWGGTFDQLAEYLKHA